MIQKATWIIPGILVTLLLGLLWAMPAFAAEAGDVEFLDKSDGDEIGYVSLNGPAKTGDGFWLQITDSDLDKVVHVKHIGTVLVPIPTPGTPTTATPGAPAGTSWFDLQNLDSNAAIDSRDFKLYSSLGTPVKFGGTSTAELDEVHPTATITYDASLGRITVNNDAGAILGMEYKIKATEIIGARQGEAMTKTVTVTPTAVGDNANVDVGSDAAELVAEFTADTLEYVSATTAWLDVLESSAPTIRDMVFVGVANDDQNILENAQEKADAFVAKLLSDVNVRAVNVNTIVDEPLTLTDNEGVNLGKPSSALTVVATATVKMTDDSEDADNRYVLNDITSIVVSDTMNAQGVVTAKVGQFPIETLAANVDKPTAKVEITVPYVGTASRVYKQGLVGAYKNRENDGMVTIQSDGHGPFSVILQETGSTTGVYGAYVKICDASVTEGTDACGLSQRDEDRRDGPITVNVDAKTRQVMLPVNPTGDTIRVAYSDASPSTTRRAEIALDVNAPTLSNFSPESGTAGSDDEPELFFEAVDAESGIAEFDEDVAATNESIQAVVALFERDASKHFTKKTVTFKREHLSDDDEITGGFAASFEVSEGKENDLTLNLDNEEKNQYEIRWWAIAVDQAGNTGVSDQKEASSLTGQVEVEAKDDTVTGKRTKFKTEIKVDEYIDVGGQVRQVQSIASNTSLTVTEAFDETTEGASATTGTCYPQDFKSDLSNIAGCDPHIIQVDTQKPTVTGAVTGTVLGDDNKPKADNSLTSIQVIFDEALDCDTVSADDFEVDGTVPNDVNCYGSSVYLSVDEMDRDAKPDVELVGTVMDSAGNTLDSEDDDDLREQTAKDGIGASITATVAGTAEGDRPITDKRISVSITSDERLSNSPSVEIRKVGENYGLVSLISGTGVPTGNSNEWTFERNITASGLYNVYVSGDNVGGVKESDDGMSGKVLDDDGDPVDPAKYALSKDDLEEDDIILFEVDNKVQGPSFEPDNDGETDNPNVFIRMDFATEGKEYGLKGPECTKDDADDADDKAVDKEGKCPDDYTETVAGDATTTASDIAADFDTSSTLEMTKATFDGEDVTEDIISRDNILFVYRPGNLTLGDHKLVIEVTDKAGNDGKGKGFSTEFTVTERKPYSLDINPGPNLISFPANPANGDVNAVFGGEGNEDITRVVSFDNATELWMAATKGADGMFMGDLTTINGMNGYWVVSDGIVDLSVVLEGGGDTDFVRPPPHIAVQKGWNLIGVVDTGQSKAGTGIATSDYFANIEAQVVYGWDSLDGTLVRLSIAKAVAPETQDMVKTGAGYWVYANEAGIIIP